jgi:hypothetical protein
VGMLTMSEPLAWTVAAWTGAEVKDGRSNLHEIVVAGMPTPLKNTQNKMRGGGRSDEALACDFQRSSD